MWRDVESGLTVNDRMRKVAIVGAALSDCGRVDDKTAFELVQQGSARAMADAGLEKHQIDGFGCGGLGQNAPVEVCEYLGLAPRWVDGTMVGGSTWEFMVAHATHAIAAGQIDTAVLSYGSTTRADLKRKRRTAEFAMASVGPRQFEVPWGVTLISRYAMAARRHMAQYGTTIDQLGAIAVDHRYNASLNPEAYYRDPITLDEVHSSRMMADPLTKLQCCIRSDGGGAVVLAAEEVARDCRKKPVWVLGTGETVSHISMSQWPDMTESPCVASGREAFGRAGVTPGEIDVACLYDSFTITVLMTLEGLGFCKLGEGGAFVEGGRLRVGGALPTNPDGGGLSACHPGQRGMFLLVEAVKQLRNECDARQVADAKLACVNGTGGYFSSTGTVILGRD